MTDPAGGRFAKDRLDLGLLTDNPAMVEFVADEVGLGTPERLRIARTAMQHRFDVRGSIVKVNVADALPTTKRSGYRELILVDENATQPRSLTGPDDVKFAIVPPGWQGIDHMAVRLATPSLDATRRFFREALCWDVDGDVVTLGATRVLLENDANAPADVPPATRGWTYLTVQIRDCDQETQAAVAGGATITQPAKTLGDVARFSLVADPFGNQVELSQRASLTGPLPK